MRRRQFIATLAGAAAGPLSARAQQGSLRGVGYLDGGALESRRLIVGAFLGGLSEGGYVDGRNVAIEYRFAEGNYERLPALAKELVDHRVAVMATGGGDPAVLAAKAATSAIPIVFTIGN